MSSNLSVVISVCGVVGVVGIIDVTELTNVIGVSVGAVGILVVNFVTVFRVVMHFRIILDKQACTLVSEASKLSAGARF